MRIVGGKNKGQQITAPASLDTRPTSDRVRESIFNILAHGIAGFELEGARVLDLFAGSGALGLEALSRGARFAQFVEEASPARGSIRRNADQMGIIGQCKIWRRDVSRLGPCAPLQPFDLVFADPPYGKGLASKALVNLVEGKWIAPGGVIVIEEAAGIQIDVPDGLDIVSTRDYGGTQVVVMRVSEESA